MSSFRPVGLNLSNISSPSSFLSVTSSINGTDNTKSNETNTIQFHGEEYDLGDLVMAGDIMMTRDQIDDEIQHNNNNNNNNNADQEQKTRKRRNLVGPARPVTPWKNGIVPYIFNEGMSKFL